VLHRALAQAVRWEWIWLNPASSASPPRLEPAEVRPPTPQHVAALLESVRSSAPDLYVDLRLAVCTGARRISCWRCAGRRREIIRRALRRYLDVA
jgi:hypothetical protein